MTGYALEFRPGLKVLVISPHPDDGILGAGASVLRLMHEYRADIHYAVLSTHGGTEWDGNEEKEAIKAVRTMASITAGNIELSIFRDELGDQPLAFRRFLKNWYDIRTYLRKLDDDHKPQLVILPSSRDTNEDHRVVADAASGVFREGQTLLRYEIKGHGPQDFNPNLFVNVGEKTSDLKTYAEGKVRVLLSSFQSQRKHGKPYYQRVTILGGLSNRGLQCHPEAEWSEAFEAMIRLPSSSPPRPPAIEPRENVKVLCIAPHPDDIELWAGATLLRLRQEYGAEIHYAVLCVYSHSLEKKNGNGFQRLDEVREASRQLLGLDDSTWRTRFHAYNFADTVFPSQWRDIQDQLERLAEDIKPHLVVLPGCHDVHQDHQTTAQAAIHAFRHGETMWHYETIQYGLPRFESTLVVDVSTRQDAKVNFVDEKLKLLAHFKSQSKARYFKPNVQKGFMADRGQRCGRDCRFAEAFESRISL